MAYEDRGLKALDYKMCRYGRSKLEFRGPAKTLDGEYIAFLGGNETFGKYVPDPFPDLIETDIGIKAINLACMHAGPDAYLGDPKVMDICNSAQAVVLQAPHTINLSNRFFTVHSRRNDRFLRASSMFQSLFSELDFTDFTFVRHMLSVCRSASAEKFELVVKEMQKAWVMRMGQLLKQIECPKIVFALQAHHPSDQDNKCVLGPEPFFVQQDMLDGLGSKANAVIRYEPTQQAVENSQLGMVFPLSEEHISRHIMGPSAHEEVAEELSALLKKVLK